MGIKFLITVSAFLLMNGGLPNTDWIQGIESFWLSKCIFINKWS